MPGLLGTADKHRARKRQELNALLVSRGCGICPASAGESCDRNHDDSELLVLLDRDPLLLAHVPRIARVTAGDPAARRLVLAQFEDGQAPAGLTGGTT